MKATDTGSLERGRPPVDPLLLVRTLEEAPALKRVLLARMEEEFQSYRLAVERTLDAVADLLRTSVGPLADRLALVERRLERLEQGEAAASEASRRPARQRIRWGSTPEEIRETVFRQLDLLRSRGRELTTETIKSEVPSLLRWIYGERALFEGMEGLRRAYESQRGGQSDGEEARGDAAPLGATGAR
ncbi:MAG: hypothetical protein K6U79_09040 [Firmicutes bacterium]|nr:hypothetical protein [Bacillota bacterium]